MVVLFFFEAKGKGSFDDEYFAKLSLKEAKKYRMELEDIYYLFQNKVKSDKNHNRVVSVTCKTATCASFIGH